MLYFQLCMAYTNRNLFNSVTQRNMTAEWKYMQMFLTMKCLKKRKWQSKIISLRKLVFRIVIELLLLSKAAGCRSVGSEFLPVCSCFRLHKAALFTLSQLTQSEEAFLRSYAGVVHSQMSQLPQHNIDQGKTGTHTLHKVNNNCVRRFFLFKCLCFGIFFPLWCNPNIPTLTCCRAAALVNLKARENPSTHLILKECTAQQTNRVPWLCMGTIQPPTKLWDYSPNKRLASLETSDSPTARAKLSSLSFLSFSIRKYFTL